MEPDLQLHTVEKPSPNFNKAEVHARVERHYIDATSHLKAASRLHNKFISHLLDNQIKTTAFNTMTNGACFTGDSIR